MAENFPNINIGLGTAAIGRPQYINLRQDKANFLSLDEFKRNANQLLDNAYYQGIRYFDTAPGYGIAEQLLIDWLRDRKHVDVEIATKWGYTYVANFQKDVEIHEVKEHSAKKLHEQWLQSKNLLPQLTSYQIHSATLDSGVLENQEVLEKLGQLRSDYRLHIGITTSGANQQEVLKRSLEIEINGKALFDVFQVTYNLLDQSLMKIARQLTAENKRVVVKEALANGRIFTNRNYPQYALLYAELERLALKYQVGQDAIAMRFCLESISPFTLLSGASTVKQLTENLSTMEFSLEEDDLDGLYQFAVSPENYWQERKHLSWN